MDRLARALAWLALAPALAAAAPPAPRGFDALPAVVGEERTALVEPEDTLLDVAYRYKVGHVALERLNPDVDPWIPAPGTIVRLPTRSVPPRVERRGLAIDVAGFRLYDFRSGDVPEVFHVAVGDAADPTILGRFRIGDKRAEPFWHVPSSIQQEKPELPPVVPPGPDNPLGERWMTIGTTSYGVHGTNNPWSIGREATHGCVRLYDEEMRRLFERTPSGTPLQIVYEPYKWGRDGEAIVLEAHPDLYARFERPLDEALRVPRELGLLDALDLVRVTEVLAEARGVPERVGTRPDAAPAATSGPTS